MPGWNGGMAVGCRPPLSLPGLEQSFDCAGDGAICAFGEVLPRPGHLETGLLVRARGLGARAGAITDAVAAGWSDVIVRDLHVVIVGNDHDRRMRVRGGRMESES